MKKVIALVLVAIMLTFVCVSCGKPEDKPTEETTAEVVETTGDPVESTSTEEVTTADETVTTAAEEVTTEAATEKAA